MEILHSLKDLTTLIVEVFRSIIQPFFEVLIQYYLDNPMFKIILAFVPVLLSIAYPLTIQTIGRLNDHYNSSQIINLFKQERIHRLFLWNLRVSVALTILCFILSLEVFLLAFVSVITLIILFFKYLNLLSEYQNSIDLFELYIKRIDLNYDPTKKIDSRKVKKTKVDIIAYWYAFVDILKYSIQRKDRNLENNVLDLFVYKSLNYIKHVDQKQEDPVLFPSEIYNSTYDIITAYINSGEKDYYQNFDGLIGYLFFTETYGDEKIKLIHKDTYWSIWRNLGLLIENGRGDKVYSYWMSAHQYCRFYFSIPNPILDTQYSEIQESISNRARVINARIEFIQFHTSLGAYLYYKRDFITLKKIWFFTQSQPPDYALFPDSMEQILSQFLIFLDDKPNHPNIAIQYWFKGVEYDALNFKKDVKWVIREYLVLLFLRLYISDGYYGTHPLQNFPAPPLKQIEKTRWNEGLKVFLEILKSHLSNSKILKALELDEITNNTIAERGLLPPTEYIEKLLSEIDRDFKKTIEKSPLDESKVSDLDRYTIEAIKEAYIDISRIKGNDIEEKDRDTISVKMEVIRGTRVLLNREAFISDPSVHYLNSDRITGEMLKRSYYQHFVTKLALQKRSLIYHVQHGNQFLAIEKLNPSPDKYIIITFNLNAEYLNAYMNLDIKSSDGQEDYTYNGIKIFNFNFSTYMVANSIFLLKSEDKPMIKHKDWTQIKGLPEKTEKHWNKLVLIDDNLKIYRNSIELNNDKVLMESYIKQGKSEEELKNMIEYEIDFLAYCWFKKETYLIEIKESLMFKEGGSFDDLDSIKPLK